MQSHEIEIIRDPWGIPHIYAETEEAGFYGLGHAMAEDRLLQMTLKRREALGSLAEVLGPGPDGKFLRSDRLSRTLDLAGSAAAELQVMGAGERRNLEAFAAGVSAYIESSWEAHSPLFVRYGGKPEPWTAEHTLALWSRLCLGFAPAWAAEAQAKRDFEKDPKSFRKKESVEKFKASIDEEVAIVTEKEFKRSYPEAHKRLKAIKKEKVKYNFPDPPEAPKASHNWVVGGKRSTTGKPLLAGKPQLTVQNPGMTYEYHLCAGRYNVRGMTWAGAPIVFVGFNETSAWAVTALNSDTGDLFEEKANPENPGQYLFRGEWKPFRTRTETIRVKGGEDVVFEVRETGHGPVVNDQLKGVNPGEIFAAKMTFIRPESSSIGSMIQMMRSGDWDSMREAMKSFYAPGTHFLYGDSHGDIAYQSLVKIPARRYRRTLPRQGWTGEEEWEMLPFEFMPSIKNPKVGYISTANGLPTGSWHPYVTCNGFGGGPREMRLREIFTNSRVFSFEDFIRDVHRDSVNVAVRDVAALAEAIIAEDGAPSEEVARAVEAFRGWDFQMLTDAPQFPVANAMLGIIEKSLGGESWHGDPRLGYVTGWHTYLQMLRVFARDLREDKRTPQDPALRKRLVGILEQACKMVAAEGPAIPAEGHTHDMPYQDNSGGFGSLAPEYDQKSPPLRAPLMPTIWSQRGETYVQIADLSDLDKSVAISPPGVSERPGSPHFNDQLSFWAEGNLRAAPLSRRAVDAIKMSSTKLNWPDA